ncbi:hypothetical protein [Paenibacillus sp. TH7-28]
MKSMLDGAGLQLEAMRGSYDGEAYDKRHSPRMILLGHREP